MFFCLWPIISYNSSGFHLANLPSPKTEIMVSYKMEPCSWIPNPTIPTRILSPQSPPIMLSSPGPRQNEETNTGFSRGRIPPPSPLCASCCVNDNGVRCAPHAYTLAGPRGHKRSLAQDTPSVPTLSLIAPPFTLKSVSFPTKQNWSHLWLPQHPILSPYPMTPT